jgi:uncharacterized membrane protein
MPTSKKLPKDYENNPFFVASNGLTLLFSHARQVGIFLVALSVIVFFYSSWPTGDTNSNEATFQDLGRQASAWSTTDWAIAAGTVFIIGLAIAMIAALFDGVASYTAAEITKGRKVSFNQAFRVAFDHLWSYLWLKLIITVKVILWSLLLIVPGIIMAVRYSLAGVAYFDDSKNLRGNAAVKESLRMTKGAWLTTYASGTLFNILTLGIINYLVTASANAVLYKQFDKLDDNKPEAHMLSWLTLILPIVLVVLAFVALIALGIGIGLASK